MNISFFEQWQKDGLVSEETVLRIRAHEKEKLFSLHWELKTLLYLGVLLLSSGLGILIYKNLDSLGHQVISILISILSLGCFWYCYRVNQPFSLKRVASPNSFFDYILLLACLSMLTLVAYLQYQYQVFGTRYGLATFIPMLILFFCAYYFDSITILSLAIVNLCAWAGIAVTPARILRENDFNNETLIITGVLLGILLLCAAHFSKIKLIKDHFAFTYSNFGTNLIFISCLAGLFHFDAIYLLWFLALAGLCIYFYLKAVREKSFYYLMLACLYGFIGTGYVVIDLIFSKARMEINGGYLVCFYFIAASAALIVFLVRMNKKLKSA